MNPDLDRALAIALRMLERSDRLEVHLRAAWERRGIEIQAQDDAIEQLRKWGFLDDAKVLARWMEAQLERGNQGKLAIARKLVQLGLPEDAAERWTASITLEEEVQIAQRLVRAKFGPKPDLARAARYLSGRGFDEEAVREALNLDDY